MRYELGFLLAVVVAATACAGHDEVAAQAQWAADAPAWVLTALGAEWVAVLRASTGDGARLPAVAIDGKSVRGAAGGGHARPHLLGAATHDGAIVIAQRQIPDKGSEIGELAINMTRLDAYWTGHPLDRTRSSHLTRLDFTHAA